MVAAGANVLVTDYDGLNARITALETINTALSTYLNFTPVWTAVTVNPAIGNGTISGMYLQVGKMVHYWGTITAGTTTTFGTGAYRISMPIAANATFTAIPGSFYFRDTGTNDYFASSAALLTSTSVQVNIGSTYPSNTVWAPTVPVTMANQDSMRWSFVYPAA